VMGGFTKHQREWPPFRALQLSF